jgi:DNA end-binding protein Ku
VLLPGVAQALAVLGEPCPRLRNRRGLVFPREALVSGHPRIDRSECRLASRRLGELADLLAPYYIAPDDKVAQEAFAVIRDAMKTKGKAGIARVVISRRERMVLLEPLGKGIMATLLRYPYEVRGEEAYFEDIPELKLPDEMLDLASHIIDSKSADFEPAAFEDRYENALVELLKSKQAGKPVVVPEVPRPSNVVNLMDALRKSIQSERDVARKKAPSKTSADRAPAKASKKAPAKARKSG